MRSTLKSWSVSEEYLEDKGGCIRLYTGCRHGQKISFLAFLFAQAVSARWVWLQGGVCLPLLVLKQHSAA